MSRDAQQEWIDTVWWLKANVIFFAILGITLFISFKLWEERLQFSYVPDGLGVNKILYAAEESWGGGPGGNETGVIVYELPDSVAEEIRKAGVGYLAKLHSKSKDSNDWHGRFENWRSTPIVADKDWVSENRTTPRIGTYLDKYGFRIPIDSQIEWDINSAISKPGSYFAYGRIGVLIVIPEKHQIVFAYRG